MSKVRVWQYYKRCNETDDGRDFEYSRRSENVATTEHRLAENAVREMAEARPNDDPCTWVVRFSDGHLELWESRPTVVIHVHKDRAIAEDALYR